MEYGKIYCVDDDPDILLLYHAILTEAGHDVIKISNGEKALETIEMRQPDLIILDEMMNDISGMEMCQRIRNNKVLLYIPIIMVTGLDSKEGKIKSLEGGIDDYMLKPFDHEELLAKVQVMLRIKRLYSELWQTRQDLVKAEKLAAVGQLAAAMAHEIRNPLSIIGASMQFLQSKLETSDERRGIMDTILRKILEIDSTVRELLVVARPLKLKIEPLDLNECIQEVDGFIKEKCLAQRVTHTQDLFSPMPQVSGDREHLQRALLNIYINALNSMPRGGELFTHTYWDQETGMVNIRIKDTGEGISAEDLGHIFEPFFSKRVGGSGLGLFVLKMIIDELRGRIEVKSELQKGTTFSMFLPYIKK
jgi:signal transduction histidine kinase